MSDISSTLSSVGSSIGSSVSGMGGSIGSMAGSLGQAAMGALVSARLAAATEPPEELSCKINPNEFSVQKSASLHSENQVGDVKQAMTIYNGPSPSTMNVNLIFDDTGLTSLAGIGIPVPLAMQMLLSWTEPTPASELLGPPSPPVVDFSWGATQHFLGHVESVRITYKLFRMGVAVRAEVDLTMRSVSLPLPMTNPTSGGRVPRKSRTVVEGDSLASIAQHAYGKPAGWRSVAEANGIDDPTRLSVGRELLLPDRSEAELPRR